MITIYSTCPSERGSTVDKIEKALIEVHDMLSYSSPVCGCYADIIVECRRSNNVQRLWDIVGVCIRLKKIHLSVPGADLAVVGAQLRAYEHILEIMAKYRNEGHA